MGQPRMFDDTQLIQLRAEYAELRAKGLSKNKCCETLAEKYYCGVSTMWTYMETDTYGSTK